MNTWPRGLVLYLVVSAVGLVWTGIAPFDRTTWWLEVAPVLIGVALMLPTARRFPLSSLLYLLLSMHAIVLMVGGHWTYARVPIGDMVMEWVDLARNPYDRLGHLFQGFVPAILTRELFLRTSNLGRGKWLVFVSIAAPLAFSAFYEMLEWWTALAAGAAATDFLGTQGDVWDTQWDMFLAGLGAVLALATLSRLHDRSLARLVGRHQAVVRG
jgi:putative membrane protein